MTAIDTRLAAHVPTRMTTSTKQSFLIAFSCVLVGCAVGATMPRLAAQSYPPNPSAQTWEQFCERIDGQDDEGDQSLVNNRLGVRGSQGFELVSTSFDPASNAWACFKRQAAR